MKLRNVWVPLAFACLAVVSAAQAADQGKAPPAKGSDVYDEVFARSLEAARTTRDGDEGRASIRWMAGLGRDSRARDLHDLVTVRVVENISGTGVADSSLDKNSSSSASLNSFFGIESKLPGFINPSSLASTKSNTGFKGGGATTRSSLLTATLAARVAEVLPNGDLVLEGIREIEINGDRQVIVLTGVARPADISPENVILSTSIAQLRIRYFGRGLMKDNLKPGWLIRILNKVF